MRRAQNATTSLAANTHSTAFGISACCTVHCYLQGVGGGLAIEGRTRALMVGLRMTGNTASYSGGAVYNMDVCDLVSGNVRLRYQHCAECPICVSCVDVTEEAGQHMHTAVNCLSRWDA